MTITKKYPTGSTLMEDRRHVTTSPRKTSVRSRLAALSLSGCLILISLTAVSVAADDALLFSEAGSWVSDPWVPREDWQCGSSADVDASLVAYARALNDARFASNLQPPAPEPIAGEPEEAPSIQQAETLGEEPEEQPLQFLRQVTPLLAPGQWQFDYGIRYLMAESEFPSIAGDDLVVLTETRIRQRLLTVPLELRYGLYPRAQVFITAPFGWSNTELSFVDFDESTSTGGIGDVTAGLTYLLRQGDHCRPDIIGTFAFTAPTGNAGSLVTTSLFTPQAQLGQGFWALSGNVLAVHSCDPLVIFYGLGARFRFSHDFTDIYDAFPGNEYTVEPGAEYSYQFGVGLAITPRITLSTSLFGGYIVEDRINGDRLERGNLEPIQMRLATTIARPHNIVEPYANIGMTNDAPDALVGITWTY